MEQVRYVIKFSFDGNSFRGYARQPEGGTVEDELIDALRTSKIIDDVKIGNFASASRVDRGVSAIGAAAAFDTQVDPRRVLRSLNAHSWNVIAHSIASVDGSFDPRRQADSRWYRYHFREEGLPSGLDVPLMREAALLFMGEHDLSAFAKVDGRNPTRMVQRIALERQSGSLVLDVWGASFLWNQVLRMASSLLMVGTHEVAPEEISDALETGMGRPFPPAPPKGLFLMDVIYDGIEFERVSDLPSGTTEHLRDEYHQKRCSLKYLEYMRERIRF
jgi:tRNA pseudouridine(38-40) synthase